MTNRDKVNALSNREMAVLWDYIKSNCAGNNCVFYACPACGGDCLKGFEAWLGLECEAEENPPADKIDKPRKHLPREKLNSKTMINGVTTDDVNHPAHYTGGKIEVIDFIEDKELGFHLGNAVKYISRAGRKDADKTVEDLRKAVWYINRQIQRLECVEND